MHTIRTHHLADDLAAFGPRALELELARYARDARALGASPLALAILEDRTAPEVARQRAFGHVVASVKRVGQREQRAA
jgi:hypothetical protein